MVLRQAGAIGSISSAYGPARYDVVTQKCKNPTEMNPVGFLVLATSYSRTACRRTTIGAAAFHFRVRNGNGWSHCARVTRVRCRTGGVAASRPASRYRTLETMSILERTISYQQSTAADPLTSTYRSSFRLRQPTVQPSFVSFFRSFDLLCMPSFAEANDGLTEK